MTDPFAGPGAGELHPDLDPNPCEAYDASHGGSCGTFVPYEATKFMGAMVVCESHFVLMCGCGTSIEDPRCCTNEPTFDDWLARRVDAEVATR